MRIYVFVIASLLSVVFCCTVGAHFAMPEQAPVDRLIANTKAYIKENPNDDHAYYTLGRIHYLAFATKLYTVGQYTYNSEPLPNVAEGWLLGDLGQKINLRRGFTMRALNAHAQQLILGEMGYKTVSDIPHEESQAFWEKVGEKFRSLEKEGWEPERPSTDELVGHAVAAMENFRKAIEMKPDNGLYHLGYASLLEQYCQFLEEEKFVEMPKEFRKFILLAAKEVYYQAYRLSIRSDLKHKEMPIMGLESLVGYEAGRGFLRIEKLHPASDKNEKGRFAAVERSIKKLDNLPIGAITPIVFSMEGAGKLDDLLAKDSSVRFDLDGDGAIERWPWVKAGTGILVWDPEKKGNITSGRQLIGSVTWWLFFEDGYHVLDALDDDRDGNLAGEELVGLAVWVDKDCDGISDQGEVTPIEKTPIAALATNCSRWEDGSLVNPQGLTLKDGRILPTYDWITEPVGDGSNKDKAGLLTD